MSKRSDSLQITSKNSHGKPIQVFNVTDNGNREQVQCLAFFEKTLIVGTNTGRISGYIWYKNRLTKKMWGTFITNQNMAEPTDLNCFWLQTTDNILYAGCGDNSIYALSLETGKTLRSFGGHTDYVHWIDGTKDALYSASEDGSVKFWDKRDKQFTAQLHPYKDSRLERTQYGKWQGVVSVTDDDWLLCGGGPKPSLYHLRSLECSTIFDGCSSVHVAGFLDDIVYIGGDNNALFQYNLKGEVTAEIPVSSSSIYTVVSQTTPERFMSIAGASNYLDMCTNFNYKDISVKLYETPNNNN